MLRSYFRLDDDVRTIWRDLAARDKTLLELHRRYGDVRVRRHPTAGSAWSPTSAPPTGASEGIRSSTEKIAAAFGERIELGGDVRHAFPTVERVLAAGEAALDGLCLGLGKHHRILAAAREIADGRLDLDELAPSSSPLRRRPDATDGPGRDRAQDRRLHRALRARQAAGFPRGPVGAAGARAPLLRRWRPPPTGGWSCGRSRPSDRTPVTRISSSSMRRGRGWPNLGEPVVTGPGVWPESWGHRPYGPARPALTRRRERP